MKSKYYEMLAKALISNADGICNAIDRYLAKADEEMAETLKDEGYLEPEETVEMMNHLEDEVADILQDQTATVVEVLRDAEKSGDSWDTVKRSIETIQEEDDIAAHIADIVLDLYEAKTAALATSYIHQTDSGLEVSALRARTHSWIEEWCAQLGSLMQVSAYESLGKLIEKTISDGNSIADLTEQILEGGWRSEYYQAKRVAVTEVLRAHSVAAEEAIQQSPACDRKEWRHTGAHKIKPRPNHVAMDHQIVPKDEPFEMQGKDGAVYYPMCPRDPNLPAAESINCHCIHRGIVNDDILAMPLEERQAMQQKIIDEDDGEWEKELDAQNKAKAGIEEYNALEEFEKKSRSAQIKYIGGLAKMGLYDAGLIDSEEMLLKVKKSTLQELHDDGIFTVSNATLKHATVGEFTKLKNPKKPAGGGNGGNMKNGGHSQLNIDELINRGISYSIDETYSNGVRVGGVENHTVKKKGMGTRGQSWFPESWSSDKVRAAGTYVSNRAATTIVFTNKSGNVTGYQKAQIYDGVKVVIFEDGNHDIKTIFPDSDQREVSD